MNLTNDLSPQKKAILKQTGALLTGHFRLSSGLHSAHYFQCARLLQYPSIASQIAVELADPFSGKEIDVVVSPAPEKALRSAETKPESDTGVDVPMYTNQHTLDESGEPQSWADVKKKIEQFLVNKAGFEIGKFGPMKRVQNRYWNLFINDSKDGSVYVVAQVKWKPQGAQDYEKIGLKDPDFPMDYRDIVDKIDAMINSYKISLM